MGGAEAGAFVFEGGSDDEFASIGLVYSGGGLAEEGFLFLGGEELEDV